MCEKITKKVMKKYGKRNEKKYYKNSGKKQKKYEKVMKKYIYFPKIRFTTKKSSFIEVKYVHREAGRGIYRKSLKNRLETGIGHLKNYFQDKSNGSIPNSM